MVGTVPPVVADARSETRKATSSAAFEVHLEHEQAQPGPPQDLLEHLGVPTVLQYRIPRMQLPIQPIHGSDVPARASRNMPGILTSPRQQRVGVLLRQPEFVMMPSAPEDR